MKNDGNILNLENTGIRTIFYTTGLLVLGVKLMETNSNDCFPGTIKFKKGEDRVSSRFDDDFFYSQRV